MMPLVLIPGMMCDARMWGKVARFLGVPVLHHLPVEADSMPALAARFLGGAPARFGLAGLSMGGILAMEILRQAPDRVERLALFDTNPLAETPEVRARRGPQVARVLDGQLRQVMQAEMKPNYLAQGPNRLDILDLCMDMALSLGPEVFARQSRALAERADQQATLAAFTGPALVLMGAEDRLCPLERHLRMHRLLPQSRLEIVQGAGHLPPLEQPERTARALRAWLALDPTGPEAGPG